MHKRQSPIWLKFSANCNHPQAAPICCAAPLPKNPAALVRDGGVIAEGFDTRAGRAAPSRPTATAFAGAGNREKARTGIPNLRVQFNKVHGFYIEVTSSHLASVPDDYRRRQTLKNAERFITPELKRLRQGPVGQRAGTGPREMAVRADPGPAPAPCARPHATGAGLAARWMCCARWPSARSPCNWCAPSLRPSPASTSKAAATRWWSAAGRNVQRQLHRQPHAAQRQHPHADHHRPQHGR